MQTTTVIISLSWNKHLYSKKKPDSSEKVNGKKAKGINSYEQKMQTNTLISGYNAKYKQI